MFDQIDLIVITQEKNKNGEIIKNERRVTVAATAENVTRQARERYNQEGLGRALRFKISLFGPMFWGNVVYFEHNGRRYTVEDFTRDKTGTSYYIEGVTSK